MEVYSSTLTQKSLFFSRKPSYFSILGSKVVGCFFLHFVLKDRDILVTPFFPVCSTEASQAVSNRSATQNDILERSEPNTKWFD